MSFDFEEALYDIPEKQDIEYLYKNSSQKEPITFVIGDGDNNPSSLELLGKISMACGLNIEEEINLIVLKNDFPLSIKHLIREDVKARIIFFGSFEEVLKTQFAKNRYRWMELANNKVLISDSLMAIGKEVKYKKALWTQLKNEFNP